MAKKRSSNVNKSQAIRDYLGKRPSAGPKEVIEALGKEGIDVSVGLVSNVKYMSGPGGGKKKKKVVKKKRPGRRPGRRARNDVATDALFRAKEFADSVGGIADAKRVLDALERLQ